MQSLLKCVAQILKIISKKKNHSSALQGDAFVPDVPQFVQEMMKKTFIANSLQLNGTITFIL